MASRKLLTADHFEPIFEPLLGRRVGYVPTTGGVGDRLVELATLQLFAHFGVDYLVHTVGDDPKVDVLVLSGGGAGPLAAPRALERLRLLAARYPTTLLPRSLAAPVAVPLRRGYVREGYSLRWLDGGILMPDLLLGLEVTTPPDPETAEGLWLRRDIEGRFAGQGLGDPDLACRTAAEYLALAARFGHVITDRPEFAVAALVQGRDATLLPGASPLNRSLFTSWLGEFGCRWQDRHADVRASRDARSVLPTRGPVPARAARVPAPTSASGARPVFVIGAPRSGTTALGKAIGRHSHFYAGDETLFLMDLFGAGHAEQAYDRWAGRPSSSWLRREQVSRDDFLAALGVGVQALLAKGADGLRWVDHTPSNALMAETLAGLFPGARFLHVLRDGREVVHSMLNVPATLSGDDAERMRQAQFLPDWTRDFDAACDTWQRHVQSAAAFERAHPERCLTVRHRDLEADPAGTMAAVFAFLDAPDEARPAKFLQRGRRANSSFAPPGGCRAADYRRPDPRRVWDDDQRMRFAVRCDEAMAALGLVGVTEGAGTA